MSQPIYALSLFFHILSTVVWIGGLLITVIVVWPELRRMLETQPAFYQTLSRLRKRFYPISNLALLILLTTGMFQMASDPNYDGVLQFTNTWSRVMLLKHLAIVGMVAVGLMLQFVVTPSLERTSLLLSRGKSDISDWNILRQREVRLTWINLVLGVGVLALSAWAVSL